MPHKFLPHTADVKIQASGKNLEAAFKSAAMALKATMLRQEKIKINEKIKKKISVKGKDAGSLLYNFLEEFLFLLDAKNFMLSKITKIKIADNKLSAVAIGDKASNYKFTNEVKAITYNEMNIVKKKDKCIIQFVLDV
jgi:SHS2 domain-containing protein